jgi:hypothetical protein
MNIELTDEQRRALHAEQGKPIDLVDPATQQHYVLLAREQYERVRSLLEGPTEQAPPPPASPAAAGEEEPQRVRLRDLPTPPEVIEEVEQWCQKYRLGGKKHRQEAEEQFKLQYYFGGRAIYTLPTPEGLVVIPITGRYRGMPGLRYILFTSEERSRACHTVPSPWNDTAGEILSS